MLHVFQWETQKLRSPPPPGNSLLLPWLPSALCWQVYVCEAHSTLSRFTVSGFHLNSRPQITDPRTGSISLHWWGYSRLNTKCPQVIQILRAYWSIICLPFTSVVKQPICYLKFSLFMRALITSPLLSSRLERWRLCGLSSVLRECCSAHAAQREGMMKRSLSPVFSDACLKTCHIPQTHKTTQYLQLSVQHCCKCWAEGKK